MENTKEVSFNELQEYDVFEGPDKILWMKLGNGMIPVTVDKRGSIEGRGKWFAWNPEWQMKFRAAARETLKRSEQ